MILWRGVRRYGRFTFCARSSVTISKSVWQDHQHCSVGIISNVLQGKELDSLERYLHELIDFFLCTFGLQEESIRIRALEDAASL